MTHPRGAVAAPCPQCAGRGPLPPAAWPLPAAANPPENIHV
jgi:hypothetical protein